jgi:hypothetical protein
VGFFGTLFGRQNQPVTANDLQAIYTLLSIRVYNHYEVLGYSQNECKAKTEEELRNYDLSESNIMQAPDGIIMKIVKDYATVLSDNLTKAERGGFAIDVVNGKRLIIEHIERHRNSLLKLSEVREFPRTLDDYVFYRVRREVQEVGGDDPDQLGFSRETVRLMTNVAKAGYQEHVSCPL